MKIARLLSTRLIYKDSLNFYRRATNRKLRNFYSKMYEEMQKARTVKTLKEEHGGWQEHGSRIESQVCLEQHCIGTRIRKWARGTQRPEAEPRKCAPAVCLKWRRRARQEGVSSANPAETVEDLERAKGSDPYLTM